MKTCSSHLRLPAVLFLSLHGFTALCHIDHELKYIVGCFQHDPTQVQLEFDSEELMYADFDNSSIVYTLPPFIAFDPSTLFEKDHIYKNAGKGKKACSALMAYIILEEQQPPENKDPPESVLYPAEEVKIGAENALVCFVNHFFPPSIKVSWTKNNQPVFEGVSVSRYYPNEDMTFHQFSTLKFTPNKGDIYTCTVEHLALEQPKTRIWELDEGHESHAVGPDVYCGVGLGIGFLGVVIGTLFFVKGLEKK